ncbi:hypothetical protein PFY01_01635 [Brevundimonas vesicularis]|uniref:hypothetical protein n=2 Tax=Brevundimonas TaxID=41275 RepID=UPI0022EC8290|nr:hypothetical protein [Brevundimonas vesicularis]WBT06403.1 hypothetical protein PFY01_01635 [Brevundimonas vesicularis]
MDARILHARSGVTLEQKDDVYRVSSLRLSDPATFSEEADAQRAFDAEVAASEQDPELMSRLGGA